MTDDPREVIARTVWGEARGCGAAGMRKVANVIVNRADHPTWWGRSLIGVCLQPWQFSCRNPGDPNRAKLLAVTAADPQFELALQIAAEAVAGTLPDSTEGADSYYALSMPVPPLWAGTAVLTVVDPWHAFFRTVGVSPPGTRPNVANVSVHALTADDLNAAELLRIRS